MEQGHSYRLTNFRIIEYENIKYIVMCWEGSKVDRIEQLEGVVTAVDPPAIEPECTTLMEPKIVAVFKLETFFTCLRCGSRTVPAKGISNETRCCNKECGILNDSTFCEKFIATEILVVDKERRIRLSAFGEVVNELLGKTSTSFPQQKRNC